jgi:hypothetical protein
LEKLREGYDLVMESLAGGIQLGVMLFLHRYVGNPVLSFRGRVFFHTRRGDFHCGLRLSARPATRLGMRTTGMEFTSQMVVKAGLIGIRVSEVPTTFSPN